MTSLYVGLIVLAVLVLTIFVIAMFRTWSWVPKDLRGLGLPNGSVRALLAFAIVGAFILLMFFGRDALSQTQTEIARGTDGEVLLLDGQPFAIERTDNELFTAVLTAMSTLTGAVTAFYFATRGATPAPPKEE